MKTIDFEKFLVLLFGDNNIATLEGVPEYRNNQFTSRQLEIVTKNIMDKLLKLDTRSIRLSGEIQLKEAENILRKLSTGVTAKINKYIEIEISLALWRITGDEQSARVIAKILETDLFFLNRNYAATCLKHFPFNGLTVTALLKGVNDSNDLVRITSLNSLLALMKKNKIVLPKAIDPKIFYDKHNDLFANNYELLKKSIMEKV